MEKTKINADLIKKYHQDLVYNYSEYPTKDYWNYEFKDKEYKDSLADWLPKNKRTIEKDTITTRFFIILNFPTRIHKVYILKRY